jgi:tetratricopeptide (TPR) repeat protein
LDQALAHLLQAREAAPNEADVLLEAGQIFEQRRQFSKALAMYEQAVSADPRSAAGHTRQGIVLKQLKDYAGSVAALEKASALDPNNVEAAQQLAVVSGLHLMDTVQKVSA